MALKQLPYQLQYRKAAFYCEDVGSATCPAYKVQDSKNICVASCKSENMYITAADSHECSASCTDNLINTQNGDYVCDSSCYYYVDKTITVGTSSQQVRLCDSCDQAGQYRHDNKSCTTTACSTDFDGDRVFRLDNANPQYHTCVDYSEASGSNCSFITTVNNEHVCSTTCKVYYPASVTASQKISYRECVSNTTLDISDCWKGSGSYQFFENKINDLYECVADCTSGMYKIEDGQKICVSSCKTYYTTRFNGKDYKVCLDGTNIDAALCSSNNQGAYVKKDGDGNY